METTRDDARRFGLPIFRDRSGHEGAGQLFTGRRERQVERGLLSETGYNANYVLFRPSRFFGRVLGDAALRLNEALYQFRDQGADHVMFFEPADLEAYYDELETCIEQVRDRLDALTAYCNQGFDGRFGEALQSTSPSGLGTPAEETEAVQAANASSVVPSDNGDALAARRQRSVEQGVLTEGGLQEGWVAFHPCPFYGRLLGEIVCTLNDALRRLEGRTSHHIAAGRAEALRRYYAALQTGLAALRGELEGIIAFCQRRVA